MREKYLGVLLITTALLAGIPVPRALGQKQGPKIIAGPYLQHTTQTSAVIMWETDRPCSSLVEYGEAEWVKRGQDVPLRNRVEEGSKKIIHEFLLNGLKPQTNYFYRVSSRDADNAQAISEIYTFQTAVREDSPFAFAVMSDNQSYAARLEKLISRIWQERPNFVLNTGDAVNNGDIKEEWLDRYLKPAAELNSRVPIYIAIGNHERNSQWYYRYVSFPEPENYYSFDYGNAHFAIIDSNQDLSPGSEQYQWLEKDLTHSRASWKFVFHHHPVYTSDSDDYGDTCKGKSRLGDTNVRQLTPLYEKYKVDIVWYGHAHYYERTWPISRGKVEQGGGVVYIQTGGGGAELEDFAPTRSWFSAKILHNWQYCLVTICGRSLRMMAYDIDGRLYDYLELEK
ncbi:MAG: metallophosphoesterase family protein [Candidatus Omnitrophota bacterium]|jgi:predicted phosphodiesterase